MSIKKGDIVKVKGAEGMNPLQFTVESIKDIAGNKMVSGPFGDFAIDLVDKIPGVTKDLKDCDLTETIERLSATNYSYAEMAVYLSIEKTEFIQQANTTDSKIWTAIQKGRLESEFEINDKLAQNAKSGNITAAQIFEKNRKAKEVENLKARIFYGE